MPNELQNTNYHGAVISKKMAEALQRTPLGQELLRFEKAGDKTVMQVRLPEKGRYISTGNNNPKLEGQEFDIRINMNYLVRGMIRASMDENGNIDPNKVNKLENLCDDINTGMMQPAEKAKLVDDLIETLEIPSSRRANFKRFLSANDVPPKRRTSRLLGFGYGPVNMLLQELDSGVLQYQKAMRGELGEQEKEYAEQYKAQCENTLRSYREMADMDPEKETRILYPMDCGSFAAIMEDFIKRTMPSAKRIISALTESRTRRWISAISRSRRAKRGCSICITCSRRTWKWSSPVRTICSNGKTTPSHWSPLRLRAAICSSVPLRSVRAWAFTETNRRSRITMRGGT